MPTASSAPVVPAALDPSDPVSQLNDGFHEYYAARQRAVLAEIGPALVCLDDSLYLRIGGRRSVGPSRTRRYHEFKTISHLPLAIQAIVGDAGGELDDEARERLVELGRRAAAVERGITDRGLDPAQTERQQRLLAAALSFIDAAVARARVARGDLQKYLRDQTPDIRQNVEDAARDQLQTTHATFRAWVDAMSATQFSQLRVAVASAHQARTGNLSSQYFTVALGDRWEGKFEEEDERADQRVLTSEDVTDESSGFQLLATHAFDRRSANAFFGEEGRLGRDILADATERQLAEMFPERSKARRR